MKSRINNIIILSFVVLLSSCGGGEESPKVETTKIVASYKNGEIYYADNCAICHGGREFNGTVGFSSKSLAGLQDLIVSNMSDAGGEFFLMQNFNNLSAQRVADLKEFVSKQ